jgi:hypothetical protein
MSNNTQKSNTVQNTSKSGTSAQRSQYSATQPKGGTTEKISNFIRKGVDPKIKDIGGFPKAPGGNPFGGG